MLSETGGAVAHRSAVCVETLVAFARSCPCGVETAVAFAGEKWVFFVRFSVAEVLSVSTVAVHGRAMVMVVSRWPASVPVEGGTGFICPLPERWAGLLRGRRPAQLMVLLVGPRVFRVPEGPAAREARRPHVVRRVASEPARPHRWSLRPERSGLKLRDLALHSGVVSAKIVVSTPTWRVIRPPVR